VSFGQAVAAGLREKADFHELIYRELGPGGEVLREESWGMTNGPLHFLTVEHMAPEEAAPPQVADLISRILGGGASAEPATRPAGRPSPPGRDAEGPAAPRAAAPEVRVPDVSRVVTAKPQERGAWDAAVAWAERRRRERDVSDEGTCWQSDVMGDE